MRGLMNIRDVSFDSIIKESLEIWGFVNMVDKLITDIIGEDDSMIHMLLIIALSENYQLSLSEEEIEQLIPLLF
jgi:acyl carrier protein